MDVAVKLKLIKVQMITQLSAVVRAPECLLKRVPAGQNPSRARSRRERARSSLRPGVADFGVNPLPAKIQSAEPFHMAGLSIRSPGLNSIGISVLLLVILLQVLLLHFPGVFISSNKVLIGPSIACENNQHGELIGSQSGWSDRCGQNMYGIGTMLALCFYVPIVLVAFALLCMLLAAYAKDRTTLQCGMVCQAASALLTLGGILMFLAFFHSYLSWKDMALWFCLCVGVEVQLIVATALTRVLGQKLTSDWE